MGAQGASASIIALLLLQLRFSLSFTVSNRLTPNPCHDPLSPSPLPAGRATSGALECELLCEALGLYPSSAHELEMDGDGWAVCWSCPVLFSDDAARWARRVAGQAPACILACT